MFNKASYSIESVELATITYMHYTRISLQMNEIKNYNEYNSFSADYDIENKIGYGAYAEVFKVRSKLSGTLFAAKVIDLRNLSLKDKQGQVMEVLSLQQIKHVNI